MSTPDAPTEQQPAVRPAAAVDTRLRGRWLILARAVWLAAVVLTFGLVIAAIPYRFEQLRTLCTGPACAMTQLSPEGARVLMTLGFSPDFYGAYLTAIQVTVKLAFFAAALVIFGRRSDDRMALYVALALVMAGTFSLPYFDTLVAPQSVWHVPVRLMSGLGFGGLVLLGYLFPTGHFVPGWTRRLAVALAVCTLLLPLSPLVYASLPWWLAIVGWITTGVVAQMYRYTRVSTVVERQQTKWVVFGFSAAFAGLVFGMVVPHLLLPGLLRPLTVAPVSAADFVYRLVYVPVCVYGSAMLIPLTISISVLRYRLWDVDPLINRTLVYGTVTGTLLLIYFASVALLQYLLRPLLGQGNELAIIASTLAIAALFNPLRHGIQDFIDRRFYRRKYDAAQVLTAFSARLRDETDVERLADEVLTVVQETMQPTHVSLWLRPVERTRPSPPEQAAPEHD